MITIIDKKDKIWGLWDRATNRWCTDYYGNLVGSNRKSIMIATLSTMKQDDYYGEDGLLHHNAIIVKEIIDE